MQNDCSIKSPDLYRVSSEKLIRFIYFHENLVAKAFYDAEKKVFLGLNAKHFSTVNNPDEVTAFLHEEHVFSAQLKSIAVFSGRKFTLVPQKYFNRGFEKNILELNFFLKPDDQIRVDFVGPAEAYLIYALPAGLASVPELNSVEALVHAANPFYRAARINMLAFQTSSMFVHVEDHFFYLMVFDNNHRFLLLNSFPYKSPDDVLYHILNTSQQLQLDPSGDIYLLSGNYAPENELNKLIFKHIRYPLANKVPAELKFHPAFDHFPVHQYYNIFAAALCV